LKINRNIILSNVIAIITGFILIPTFCPSTPLLLSSSALVSFLANAEPDTTTNAYKIEPGDVLEIVVLGEDELTRTLMVMHNGNVSFPMIGDVLVTGLTTEQAGDLLAEHLKKYFTHPVVSVILKSPTLPHVSVFGEVLKPGAVEYQRGLRITDYIALAGGYTQLANLRQVKVVRFTGGKPTASTVNVDAILKQGASERNYELKSGDWIFIPRRFSVNWSTILQLATLAVTLVNLYIIVQRK